eukprot:1300952-Rhodomonas_salina.1
MKAWHALKVYDIVDEFEVDGYDVEIINGKVVYKLKLDEFSNPYQWKCRIVAHGFQESDAGETFAPMAHPVTIRAVIAIAVASSWFIKQGDVKTAYLNETLPKPVYLRPPQGLEPILGHGMLLKLKRAVYGLGASG